MPVASAAAGAAGAAAAAAGTAWIAAATGVAVAVSRLSGAFAGRAFALRGVRRAVLANVYLLEFWCGQRK